jgi:archaellum component FlaC
MNTTPPFNHALSAFYGAVLFLAFVLIGAAYIVWAKLASVPAVQVTVIPLGLMVLYALALGLARYVRLRDDQAGDNLYYLGFLYTLTSLGVSLWQFSVDEGAQGIVTNFGIAISSTILGVALRVVFNQMRQDPVEVERTARLELADAARKVKQELDGSTFEFASFRRETQQMLEEGLAEAGEHVERLKNELFNAVKEFPSRLAEPLKTASEQSKETIDKLATALTGRLEDTGTKLTTEQEKLASAARTVTSSLEEVQARLKAMQMPDGIIEIKLQPFISGLTKAINTHSKATADQITDLQKIIAQFDETVRELSEHMTQAASRRSDDLQDLKSSVSATSAETLRLLSKLEKKISANSPPWSAERTERVWRPWFWGRLS